MPSSTSSFRIDGELKLRLELAVKTANRGKNWIITRALEEYLAAHNSSDLPAEAKRQSLEASKHAHASNSWEQSAAEVWNG